MALVAGVIILWILPIFVAVSIGRSKNRAGLAYGLLLGWLGVITIALLPPRGQVIASDEGTCPYCAETIKLAARVCRHCGRDVTPASAVTDGDSELEYYCEDCGAVVDAAATVCVSCGADLEGDFVKP